MTEPPVRRRAPGMTPDQRRDTIVRAALPLLSEFGAAVTTAQIARAAGIGEATIFRVFDDKTALLEACTATAMDPAGVLAELRSIPLDQPLADRLTEAADTLDAHLTRMGTVIAALHASGHPYRRQRETTPPGERSDGGTESDTGNDADPSRPRQRSTGRDRAQAEVRAAITELLEPDRDQLRAPLDTVTDAYLRLMFNRTGTAPGAPEVDRRALIDLLLHGSLRSQEAGR